MTFADLNRISSTLSSLNIFSSASKKQQQQQQKPKENATNRIAEESNNMKTDEVSPGVFKWDKWDWAIVRSRLFPVLAPAASSDSKQQQESSEKKPAAPPPVYLRHGPGYDDFGFVSDTELIKVRKRMRDLSVCVLLLCQPETLLEFFFFFFLTDLSCVFLFIYIFFFCITVVSLSISLTLFVCSNNQIISHSLKEIFTLPKHAYGRCCRYRRYPIDLCVPFL